MQIKFEHRCPWCTREVDFTLDEAAEWRPHDSSSIGRMMPMLKELRNYKASPQGSSNRAINLADEYKYNPPDADRDKVFAWETLICPKCHAPVLFLFDGSIHWFMQHLPMSTDVRKVMVPGAAASRLMHNRLNIIATLPSLEEPEISPNMPPAAAALWPSTLRSLAANDPPPRIVSECRSVLDVCLASLGQKEGGRRTRIQNLRDNHVLTDNLAKWAHKVWDDGNEAVHEIQADRETAEQLVSFLKIFLHVVYELDAKIEEKKRT